MADLRTGEHTHVSVGGEDRRPAAVHVVEAQPGGRQSRFRGSSCLRVCRWGLSALLGGTCQVVLEASGVDEAAGGVVCQVAEFQGYSS